MKVITVKVQEDHLQTLSRVKKPILAIAELIWNGLDANANNIKVALNRNKFGCIDSVSVSDDGHGLPYMEVEAAFGSLGGSWKKETRHTRGKERLLHGKAGKGRFRAFFIGRDISWKTWYESDGEILTYQIIGRSGELLHFQIVDKKSSKRKKTGTEVEIREMQKEFTSLEPKKAVQEITEHFSLYISLYPSVNIKYDGTYIDPSQAMDSKKDYKLDEIKLKDKRKIAVNLTIIEWKNPTERKLYLCDSQGFTYYDVPSRIHAPRFNFTAYLKSVLIRELDEAGQLIFEEGHPDLQIILEAARRKLREHFKQRSIEEGGKIVEHWKKEKVYPYEGKPKDIIEQNERQVFDIVAINLPRYLPDFEGSDPKSKSLSLKLLRHALQTSPTTARLILGEVLDLPDDKQEEFGELLEKTSLEGIITASKIVADRLDFLKGLELLVFDPKSREQLLERRQLHRIIAEETWVFGEEFNLTVDDQSLTEVLKKHLKRRGEEIAIDEPVKREDGSEGIIDLMLSRRVPRPRAEEREHLIIEIKRPKQKIDGKAMAQIEDYAFAISGDERFKDVQTWWTYWALSNDISPNIRKKAKQQDRPEGMIYANKEGRMSIWVKTWSQVINDCRARLDFYQQKLRYSASNKTAIAYLREEYEKYLPGCFVDQTIPIVEVETSKNRETIHQQIK